MSRMKRIVVGLPEEVLEDLDLLASGISGRRSELIREACVRYVDELKRIKLREQMKLGYQEMGELNVLLAEEMSRLVMDELAPAQLARGTPEEPAGDTGEGDGNER
ncbi:MAG TPA: CopG family transcriptional regulator [Firmicutes bacterium]|nr:CopG family transcriptional regulator [Candidatus Fermentithermobacillaceae bacterium]